MKKVAVIGGGAAGFFAALSAAQHQPTSQVVIYEKSDKLLSKVKISGGGRCNVTNATFKAGPLSKNYPRGGKSLKKTFAQFETQNTIDWFTSRGVKLKTEADGRMFPASDSSQSIIDCLTHQAQKAGIEIRMRTPVQRITQQDDRIVVNDEAFDAVIVATGGSPKSSGFDWLAAMGHSITQPVPSLFTFNMPGESVKEMMGLVVPDALVRIQGTKLSHQGPVLITHWGMSGPAVLKLSAWGARELQARGYAFNIQINWIGIANESEVLDIIEASLPENRKKKMANACPFDLPKNFWLYVLNKSQVNPDMPWLELGKKSRNKLVNTLLNDIYAVKGKTTFKEEFVTCGGIKADEVDFGTMESRIVPGLFFAGEVLDVDGITGGFNFQAAWSTGFVAGRHAISDKSVDSSASSQML
jgi:predicted Rossmann fold flavoprotein